MIHVSDVVPAEVADRFNAPAAAGVVAALEATSLPLLEGRDRDRERTRVHLAAIKLADGDLPRFHEALALARVDCRRARRRAGLAGADWPTVRRAAGYRVP